MATTQNTYTGNGSTTNYSFTFEYLKQSDVKVTLDTVATTAFTFANATTLSFTTAPANNVAIRIFRDTAIDALSSTFFPGSAIKAEDLNNNFTQSLYVTQESERDVDISDTTANTAKSTADTALTNSATAITTANAATTTANTADTNASAAVTTANAASATATTASTDAASAVTTANTASTTAGTAVTAANSAVTTANSAVSSAATANTTAGSAVTTANAATATANTANTTAGNAVTTANSAVSTANTANTTAASAVTTANAATTTANTADTNATAAVSTANAASAAVSNAVLFTLVANVAAIPGSPSNNDYVEIGNSTGIESFSPLSGLPSGFVGASGLTVRLRYDTSATSWVFMSYFANDSETRYLTKNIPVVTGDSTNGSGQITLNCENNSHGVKIKGPPHSAAASYTLTLPNDDGTSGQALTTDGSGALSWDTYLQVDSSGRVGIGCTPVRDLQLHTTDASSELMLSNSTTGATAGSGFMIQQDGNDNYIWNKENSFMSFGTNALERMRIKSDGTLHAIKSGSLFANAEQTVAVFQRSSAAGSTSKIAIISGNSASSHVHFGDTDDEDVGQIAYYHSDNSMQFVVNNSERMRIDSSGNVGIGTSSPGVRLHVNGSTPTLRVSNGTSQVVEIKADTGASILRTTTNHPLLFGTNDTERMRIDSSGNVGIGNTVPSSYNSTADDLVVGNHSGGHGITIAAQNNDTGYLNWSDGTNGTSENRPGRIAYSHADNSFRFDTASTERLRIDSSGNVGIGTSSPSAKLHVNGSATFGGTVSTGGDTSSTTSHGLTAFNNSATNTQAAVYARNMAAGGQVWAGLSNTGNLTSSINGDGSATFAATVTANAFSGDGSALTNLPSSGGTYEAIASGTIPNGAPVVLNSDGTVSVTTSSVSSTSYASVGETFNDAIIEYTSCAYDSANGKVIIAYSDQGNSNHGTAVVGTVSGTSISFGPRIVFNSASSTRITAVFDSTNNKVVIGYRDTGNSNYGTAVVGTVDATNNSISFGSAVTFSSGPYAYSSCAYDSANGKVVFAYEDNGNSGYGTVRVGTVSGTSISFGSAVTFNSGATIHTSTTFDSNSNKVVISFRDSGAASYGRSIVGTVSGTSISFGSKVPFNSAESSWISSTFDSNSNKVVIAYRDGGNSDYGTAIVGTVSGTSISFGSEVVFQTGDVTYKALTFDSTNNKVIIAYRNGSNSDFGTAVVGTVSGTSISFGTKFVINGESTTYISAVYDPGAQQTVITYYNTPADASAGRVVVFTSMLRSTNLTTGNYIGIAAEAISNGASGKITILGGINSSQTGLTPGKIYYVQNNGSSISLAVTQPAVVAGTALSATKILVR